MKNLTIISDPGIDDLIALVLLYKLTPKTENSLIATFGNAPEEITAKNAKEFIAFVAPSWKFIDGSNLPLNGKVEHKWPDYFHGSDGLWGVHPQVDINNIQFLASYPNNEEVISLAPMTDTWQLLNFLKPKSITVMGGAFNIEGNETKYAETNIAFDPDSAKKFFNNCKGIQVKVIPLDVTRKVFWSIGTVKSIPETNPVNKWLKELLLSWFEKYTHEREKNFNLHDPLAVFLHHFQNQAVWISKGIDVITKGAKRGKTVFSNDNPQCQTAIDLSNPKNISENIYSLIFQAKTYC